MSNEKKVYSVLLILILLALIANIILIITQNKDYYDKIYYRDYSLGYSNMVMEKPDEVFLFPVPGGGKYYDEYDFHELYAPLVDFYDDKAKEWLDFSYAIPQYATSKYLSIQAIYESNDNYKYGVGFDLCLTIDFEQKKAVFLNELMDVNEEFLTLLIEGKLAKSDSSPEILEEFGDTTNFSDKNYDELKEAFDLCSVPFTSDNFYYSPLPGYRFPLFKPSFYLSPGRIYFVNFYEYGHEFYMDLADIKKSLKVDKW